MSAYYRKKDNVVSAFFKDRGFYVILVISLVMVFVAGYMAFTWDNGGREDIEEDNDESISGFDEANIPTWPDENLDEASGNNENIDNSENSDLNVVSENGELKGDLNVEKENTEVISNPKNITDKLPEKDDESLDEVDTVVIEYFKPCQGNIVKDYSGSEPVFSETLQDWRIHQGIDYFTEKSENVLAVADGIVEDVYTDGLMGVTILLKHGDGMRSIYQSLAINPKVLKGMAVKQGEIIGKTGDTASVEYTEGTHLHFAMLKNGIYCNPKDYF